MTTKETKKPLRVGIFHPDLGIGGAERLVVDIGLALKQSGHDVTFFTSHHDPTHCFPETNDGSMPVVVAGDWLPRHIFGRLNVFFAVLRSLWLIFYVYFHKSLLSPHTYRLDDDVADDAVDEQLQRCTTLIWQ